LHGRYQQTQHDDRIQDRNHEIYTSPSAGFAFIERNDWGLRLAFGRLYEWLAHESDDAAYEPLRDIIRRHVIETMPLGPGDDVFGREVTVRRLHSVRSASLEMDVHPKRLRKLPPPARPSSRNFVRRHRDGSGAAELVSRATS
jgi:hypothetical protein